ncbi:NeuD/PglB/VioB family sugar acetyltransferase [Nocardioides sp.]|uniref:NeuD/PglB/VioB family sugar acetyltransferase n=1 Tax=Nocardioides sp. TaxID=35761 RepID=UPI0037831A5D
MTRDLVVVGAGGFGREVIDVLDAVNEVADRPVFNLLGVVDDAPADENLTRLEARGVRYLGGMEGPKFEHVDFVVGIGAPATRRRVAERMLARGARPTTLIHPSATFGSGVTVGDGSVVCAGVRVTTNIHLGQHVHLNINATVGHDSSIGDFVSVNPLASISGDCVIEDEVLIGVGGVVLNGVTVGRASVVGGSACVVKDVPPGVVVKGIPAR